MKRKWVYYLGVFIVIGLIVLIGQSISAFIIGWREGFGEEATDMRVWFEEESPLRLLILGSILIGFNQVLNKDKKNESS